MVIAFFPENGLKHYRTAIKNDSDRDAAAVIIDRQRVTKNRYGTIGQRLTINQITQLPRMTIAQQEEFFRTL